MTILFLNALLNISDDYAGHGNSFHGSGGRGNKRAQMRYCIRIIRAVVSTKDEAVLQDLVDQGTINQIMGKFLRHIIYMILQFNS